MAAPGAIRGGAEGHENEQTDRLNADNSRASPLKVQPINWLDIALSIEPHDRPPRAAKRLTLDRARELSELIQECAHRGDADALCAVCVRAYEGDAHGALGLSSWPAFVESLNLRFVEDIRRRGQVEMITVMPDGAILDGRNRWRACERLGIEPLTRVYDGADPVGYVWSENFHRRHLNESQRAMAGARLASMSQGARTDLAQNCATSQPAAADLANVSRRSVQSAKKVIESGTPELVAAVDRGQIPVSRAAEIVKGTAQPPEDVPKPPSVDLEEAARGLKRAIGGPRFALHGALGVVEQAASREPCDRRGTAAKKAIKALIELAEALLDELGNEVSGGGA